MEFIQVWTDGACSGNGKDDAVGGWGAVLMYKGSSKEICGGEKSTTNNRMELTAVIEALDILVIKDIKVNVHTDSAYVCNCIKEKWYEKWQENGWRNSKKELVENQDLWVRLIDLIQEFANLSFLKVKGHSGVELNELADKLAHKGKEQYK